LLFINSSSEENAYGNSAFNKGEADVIVQIVTKLIEHGVKKEKIGFVAPYLGQI
jgi:superfamily I DNA and/or RNA helicase